MKSKLLKRILLSAGVLTFVLGSVLAVHIYLVTRPQAPDASSRAMARVDFEEDIDAQDADRITAWFYEQEGIDHVFCNHNTNILVFSFRPAQISANNVIGAFKSNFNFRADRYMPTQEAMAAGCPAAVGTAETKISAFIKQVF